MGHSMGDKDNMCVVNMCVSSDAPFEHCHTILLLCGQSCQKDIFGFWTPVFGFNIVPQNIADILVE